MEFLVLLILVAVVWYFIKRASKGSGYSSQRRNQSGAPPEIRVTVSSSLVRRGGGRDNSQPRDVGDLTSAGQNAWVLNPKSPLPLTVENCDRENANTLKTLLGSVEYWSQKLPELALLIAQNNLRIKEVDQFAAQYRSRFNSEVAARIANSSEWQDASERDRADIRSEHEVQALASLGVSVGRADMACLLKGEPSAIAEDDVLIQRFSGDSSLYSFYLSAVSRSSSVALVKAEDYARKSWEQLVEIGLARRGKDIDREQILNGMRLKEINELLVGVAEKLPGRKAKSIEVALKLPDLEDRLSRHISFREMFQVLPAPGIDMSSVKESFAYSMAVATVVQQTYYTAVRTLDAIDERKGAGDLYDAWEISNWEDPTPPCAKNYCRKYERLPAKRPPFHIGCNCQLECSYKDA
jgi:hypothetical protein